MRLIVCRRGPFRHNVAWHLVDQSVPSTDVALCGARPATLRGNNRWTAGLHQPTCRRCIERAARLQRKDGAA